MSIINRRHISLRPFLLYDVAVGIFRFNAALMVQQRIFSQNKFLFLLCLELLSLFCLNPRLYNYKSERGSVIC